MQIGLLEFGEGQNDLKKLLDNLFEYAIRADNLGFSKFWLGEHYLTNSLWYNPEILIPIIAGQTENISVGIAGTLLAYKNPYDIALKYKLLSNLFPNRIDLGIAKGTVPNEIENLLSDSLNISHKDKIEIKLQKLINLLEDDEINDSGKVIVPPYKGAKPRTWALKVDCNNFDSLVNNKMNCSISLFHKDITNFDFKNAKSKINEYKELFHKKYGVPPLINIALAGICALNTRSAKQLERAHKKSTGYYLQNLLIGSPSFFYDTFSLYKESLGINEIIFLNLAQSPRSKFRSIELLSREFNL